MDSIETRMALKEERDKEGGQAFCFSAADLYLSNILVSKYCETCKIVSALLEGCGEGSRHHHKCGKKVAGKSLPLPPIPNAFWLWFPSKKVEDIRDFLQDLHSPDYEPDFKDEDLPTVEGWYQVLFYFDEDSSNPADPASEGTVFYEGDSRMWQGPISLSKCPSVLRIVQGEYDRVLQISVPDIAESESQDLPFVDSNGGKYGNESSAFLVQAVQSPLRTLPDCSGPIRSNSLEINVCIPNQEKDYDQLDEPIKNIGHECSDRARMKKPRRKMKIHLKKSNARNEIEPKKPLRA